MWAVNSIPSLKLCIGFEFAHTTQTQSEDISHNLRN